MSWSEAAPHTVVTEGKLQTSVWELCWRKRRGNATLAFSDSRNELFLQQTDAQDGSTRVRDNRLHVLTVGIRGGVLPTVYGLITPKEERDTGQEWKRPKADSGMTYSKLFSLSSPQVVCQIWCTRIDSALTFQHIDDVYLWSWRGFQTQLNCRCCKNEGRWITRAQCTDSD